MSYRTARNRILIIPFLLGICSVPLRAQKSEKPELVIQDGHLSTIEGLAFSPDGRMLASAGGSGDGEIKLWEVKSGRLIRSFVGEKYASRLLAFSPDGTSLAAAGGDTPAG